MDSFADVVRQTVRSASHEVKNSNANDIAAAMCLEQENKARRANSFIVSGLPGEAELSDGQLVEGLCRDELSLTVEVLSCKRIGRQISDKPRKLLAYIRSS